MDKKRMVIINPITPNEFLKFLSIQLAGKGFIMSKNLNKKNINKILIKKLIESKKS